MNLKMDGAEPSWSLSVMDQGQDVAALVNIVRDVHSLYRIDKFLVF